MQSQRSTQRSTRRSHTSLDNEIHSLTRERAVLLGRKPARLTTLVSPRFGSVSGCGDKIVGALDPSGGYSKPLPQNAPHWGWYDNPSPTGKRRDDPPNLFGTFSEERLPTQRNEWSIAQRSMVDPLKTLLLDDKKRNIPRHRTRSELLASRKRTNIPHMSFDVDMDGVVSELDFKYAKAFDLDGDGILNKRERSNLRRQMSTDLFQERKVVANLAESPIDNKQIETMAEKLVQSEHFQEDFTGLRQKQQRSRIAGSSGGIHAIQHHFRHEENREYGLGTDHNAPSVKTHDHGYVDGLSGERRRCMSRTQLFNQRATDFRESAKLAAFKDDGKSLLFRRKADTSIQPTLV